MNGIKRKHTWLFGGNASENVKRILIWLRIGWCILTNTWCASHDNGESPPLDGWTWWGGLDFRELSSCQVCIFYFIFVWAKFVFRNSVQLFISFFIFLGSYVCHVARTYMFQKCFVFFFKKFIPTHLYYDTNEIWTRDLHNFGYFIILDNQHIIVFRKCSSN